MEINTSVLEETMLWIADLKGIMIMLKKNKIKVIISSIIILLPALFRDHYVE